MILFILIDAVLSHVAYSFMKFFFEFCLQIRGQDIM